MPLSYLSYGNTSRLQPFSITACMLTPANFNLSILLKVNKVQSVMNAD